MSSHLSAFEVLFSGGFTDVVRRIIWYLSPTSISDLEETSSLVKSGMAACNWDKYLYTTYVLRWCPEVREYPQIEVLIYPLVSWLAVNVPSCEHAKIETMASFLGWLSSQELDECETLPQFMDR